MDAPRSDIPLNKHHYLAGLQCPRRLWWTIHDPAAERIPPEPAIRAVLDQGRRVGEKARGYVPGGILVEPPPGTDPARALEHRIRETQRVLEARPPAIYEAAFTHDGVTVVADILERSGNHDYNLIEVKSSTSVKDKYLPDVALQLWVLRQAGLAVASAELMHLNGDCRHPDLWNLFTRADVTPRATELAAEVPARLAELRQLVRGPVPASIPGAQCDDPDDCPYEDLCWAALPEHSVWTLYNARRKLRDQLEELGVQTVDEIPDDVRLSEIQRRQREAVRRNELVVEPGLAEVLATLDAPVAYLDFETISPAIPVWPGLHPFDAAPVQLSVHVAGRDGALRHHEWLADGPADPREAIARKVVELTRGTGSVVVYNATFERRCLRGLAETVPGLAPELHDVESRLWDLLPVVRNHVYHPDFGGSFSIKSVLPALVAEEEAGYEALEIQDGAVASWRLEELLFGDLEDVENAQLRAAMLEYCRMDTLGMVKLVERLRRE